MKKIGLVYVTEAGTIHLPPHIFRTNSHLVITKVGKTLEIQEQSHFCIFCGSLTEHTFCDRSVCKYCVKKMKEKLDRGR